MALILIATPGAANANSYLTLDEAVDYFESRSIIEAWDAADNQEALLVMATRVLDMILAPSYKELVIQNERPAYYRIRPQWTGSPSTETQALAWPRTGMYNRNGFAIASDVIPQDLKNAVAELAGQLATEDRTLDNDVSVKGITSVRAGSVSVSFKSDGIATTKVLPDAVLFLLVPTWITDEFYEPAETAVVEVL